MAFTKYASFEMSEVLDIKGSPTRARTATLDKLSDFNDYRTEDGYLYARIRAISSRVNKNHDGWPSIELAGSQDVFDRHYSSAGGGFTVEAQSGAEYGYSTFLGKPIFIDHHNSDPSRARGVIVDAKLHVEDHKTAASLDPYYASAPENHTPATWVELLLEVDAKSFPKLAKAILEGSKNSKKGIDGFSMGCDVEKSVCNICKNAATAPDEYCDHVKLKGATFDYIDNDGRKTSKKSYEDCYGIRFFEISAVFDPADETALLREVVNKESKVAMDGGMEMGISGQVECPYCAGAGCQQCANMGFAAPPRPGTDGVFAPSQQQPLPPGSYMPAPGALPTQKFQGSVPEMPPVNAPASDAVVQLATQFVREGISPDDAYQLANAKLLREQGPANPVNIPGGDGQTYSPMRGDYATGLPMPPMTHGPYQGSVHTADNPLPQADLIKAPEDVDTLRDEQVCPVCGSSMDETTCEVCGYVEPPENFNNPDLTKAQDDVELPEDVPFDAPPEPQASSLEAPSTGNPPSLAHVTSDMAQWQLSVHPKVAGKINPVERPILPGNGEATNEPREEVLEDHDKPVTSAMRTARQLMTAAKRNKENNMDHQRTAAEPVPAAKPDTRVDTVGTGGVIQDSNEAASQADKQIDVLGEGGTGVETVSADQENVEVAQGNEHSKNIEAIPTKTFPNEGQQDPVTSQPWPASEDGVKRSHDDAAFPKDDGGLAGGGAVQGVKPVSEQFGDRVDLLQHTTSPANNSGPTKTWSGTDGNGVTKQQEPVTNETLVGSDGVKKSHIFMAFKLADLEVEMGLLERDQKYERAAELEAQPQQVVEASLRYAQKVKTAGLSKAPQRVARRMPSMVQPPTRQASVETTPDNTPDEGLFI